MISDSSLTAVPQVQKIFPSLGSATRITPLPAKPFLGSEEHLDADDRVRPGLPDDPASLIDVDRLLTRHQDESELLRRGGRLDDLHGKARMECRSHYALVRHATRWRAVRARA
ncbi:hypothetical protein AB0F72_35195 [Actinoplanes sp. NPDC023936]|uniref:hypothetical protein n=1 Tax=Actinoplanes sp. NPDC023936 TaxID=3154910 RepID=UPI0033C9B5F6